MQKGVNLKMTKKISKKMLVIVAILMLTMVLVACAGNNGGNDAGDNQPAATQPAATQPPAADTADTNDTAEEVPVEAYAGAMTQWGTPRTQTLIVEFQNPVDTPGQFNTYMLGTSAGSGIHQLMSAMMWEIDTMTGEQFGEVAAGLPRSSENYTLHYVDIRQGIYWSDGVPLDAHDVVFTMNMIKNTEAIPQSGFYQTVFESIEAVDDWTVRIRTNNPFPRLSKSFGVTIWGNTLRIVPRHIYYYLDDVMQFTDSDPVVAGPYTVHSFDPLGTWILFERRADWERSTIGVIHGRMPAARFIVFRSLGDDMARQMAVINNEVDVLVEVTPEMLNVMMAQNPNVRGWYTGFPYGTSDDPAAKGLAFNHDIAPFGNRYFRWGIAAALNFDDISLFVFDGIGRSSPFPLITATAAFQEAYLRPHLLDWLENEFYIELADGTVYWPYDREYAHRISNVLRGRGHDLPTDAASLYDTFGYGVWRHDPAAATQLFQMAGLELRDGNWYFEGEPFTIALSYLGGGAEIQAARGVQAAFNQLLAFGFNVTLESHHPAAWSTHNDLGYHQISGAWPFGFITRDVFAQLEGWHSTRQAPIGERGSGQAHRWRSTNMDRLLDELSALHPNDARAEEVTVEMLKYGIEQLPTIGFHSGIKFVPTVNTYWTNFPSSDNPYNGPWWWWSLFKHITPFIEPVN